MCSKKAKYILFLLLLMVLVFDFKIAYSQQEDIAKKLKEIREQLKAKELSSKVNLDDFDEMADFILSQEKESIDTGWVRNLFLPLLQKQGTNVSLDVKGELKLELRLRGIVMMDERAYALIGDEILKEGEMIDDMRVEKIEMGRVILKKGEQEELLYVD